MKGEFGLYYGIECDKGWEKLYLPLINKIEKAGGKLLQVKEKFGGLRMYAQGISRELLQELLEVENTSHTICEKCGEPGKLGNYGSNWIKTLCPTHQQERINEFSKR